ncbi:MAG: amidase [Acidimicrobiales bacterium]
MDELALLDATAQAKLVRDGLATPAELVEAAIGRIEALNPVLNAVITSLYDKALACAASPGLPDGPFRGVPFLLKDLGCHSAGDPYHCGMALLKRLGWRAATDTYASASLKAAGLVILGKTNTPELGTTPTTEPLSYGPTANPWDTSRSPGGSSGGSASAVASGMVPAAHGNDGGGSIRIPASACGLVGLKPSRGRVSAGPLAGEAWAGCSTEGVLCRTVRDAAGLLDVLAGARLGDPYTAPPPERPFSAEPGADPGGLRIGLCEELPGWETDPACRSAVRSAGTLLEGLGHEVDWSRPEALGDQQLGGHYVCMVAVATAADLDRWSLAVGRTIGPADVEPENWMLSQLGRSLGAPAYFASREWLHRLARRASSWWEAGHDVLVLPTLASPPPPLGWLSHPEEGLPRAARLTPFTSQWNVTGQPAVSLPLHWSGDGLPIGVQLVGPPFGESLLLRLAAQIEQASPWVDRRPPVHA